VYVWICVTDSWMTCAVNLFLDFIELQNVTSKWISYSLLDCLQSYEMMEDYLKTYLVCILCDSAAVMLGNKGGIMKLMKDKFPYLIVWHRSNHIL
jgi:hypothetical protein